MTRTEESYDVAILGSGLAGTVCATILARHGVDVLIVDAGTHPRFAIGESTIPHTSLLFSILASRYDVPEVDTLAYPDQIAEKINPTSGVKRAFGFAFHEEGREYNPEHGLQFGTSAKDENHLFRQDTDAYMLRAAIRYGATVRQATRVLSIDVDSDGGVLETSDGKTISARYVIDGTGFRSVLAERYDLREKPTRLQHQSRSLFTHMIDVREFEEDNCPMALPWRRSTLHHVFDKGWFWVIPFGNREGSTNPLVSVGLTLDPRKHPVNGHTPEEEFKEFLGRFPTVARQFADAKPVRPWVSTPRLQYSSKACVGDRYCLMSHAAGFVDPLYSRGMINTLEVIQALVDPLLGALADGDFDTERFREVDTLQRRCLDYNDRLVEGSFSSWASFDLWNAWLRIWALGTIVTEFRIMNGLLDYTESQDDRDLHGGIDDPIFSDFEDPDYRALFETASSHLREYETGAQPVDETTAKLFELTGQYEIPVPIRRAAMKRAGWVTENMSDRSLRDAQNGYRWALTNPTTHDLFGCSETFFRWRSRVADPHVTAPDSPSAATG